MLDFKSTVAAGAYLIATQQTEQCEKLLNKKPVLAGEVAGFKMADDGSIIDTTSGLEYIADNVEELVVWLSHDGVSRERIIKLISKML